MGLHGATVMQQALPLGLVDEIRVHVVPVLVGGGTPLFGTLDSSITLEHTRVLSDPGDNPPLLGRAPSPGSLGADRRPASRRVLSVLRSGLGNPSAQPH